MNIQDTRIQHVYHFWVEGRILTAARGAHSVAFATVTLGKIDIMFGRK